MYVDIDLEGNELKPRVKAEAKCKCTLEQPGQQYSTE